MYNKSVNIFFKDAAQNANLRERFKLTANQKEFMQTALELGYTFTIEMLVSVVQEHSEGVVLRRQTGIWPWLRSVNWIERNVQSEMPLSQKLLHDEKLNKALSELCISNQKLGKMLVDQNVFSQENLEQYLGQNQILLGQFLIKKKLIFQPELRQALADQHGSNKKLGEILVAKNIISQNQLEIILKQQYWQNNGYWVIS